MADALLLQALALQHNPWRARMHYSSLSVMTNLTAIPFDTIDYDPGNMCTTGVGAKITIAVDGFYVVVAEMFLSGPVAVQCNIWKNGSRITVGGDSGATSIAASDILYLIAGDTIQVVPNGASPTNGLADSSGTFLALTWIAPA